MVTIAICNNKGGTGKTKTTEYLARTISARLGDPSTVLDLDGQANLTDSLLGTKPGGRPSVTIADVLAQKAEISDATYWTSSAPLWLIPSDGTLDDVADDLVTSPLGVLRLKTALEREKKRPNILLIDCPPNVGSLTFAALIAADYVIIPTVPQAWALNGVQRISEKINEVKQALGHGPSILGTVATMIRNTAEHMEGLRQLLADGMPLLLGTVPTRGGLTSHSELLTHYEPIAEVVLEKIGETK